MNSSDSEVAPSIPPLLENEAVHKHLDILQAIIERLAGNASACKNWCVTIVAGAIVLSFGTEIQVDRNVVYSVGFAVVGIFLLLDSYYHGLECEFREQSNKLAKSIHAGTFDPRTLLVITGPKNPWNTVRRTIRSCATSPSTGGFYIVLAFAVFVTKRMAQ